MALLLPRLLQPRPPRSHVPVRGAWIPVQSEPGAARAGDIAAPADPWVRAGLYAVLFSIMVLPRFGLAVGEFSASVSMLAAYAALGVFAARGRLDWSPSMFIAYAACMAVASASLLVNKSLATVDLASPSSLMLLAVMYLPFVGRLKPAPGEPDGVEWMQRQFLDLAFVLAVAGIVQYYLQFVVHGRWLFDFSHHIPELLRGASGYNTVIEVDAGHKANGFFQREPSSFSFLMALALMLEWQGRRRSLRLACCALGLALSYSGTGLLALLVGLLFPLGPKVLLRFAVVAVAGGLAFVLLDDVLNLSFTLARVDEFGAERSSAYIRYIAPMKLVAGSWSGEAWSAWLGHGPGAISRAAQAVPYEYFDPTWAKLLFEYGVLGFAAFAVLVACAALPGPQSARIKAVMLASWAVMGGHLLTADNVLLLLCVCGTWMQRQRGPDSPPEPAS